MLVGFLNVFAGVAVELGFDLVERVLHPGDSAVVGATVGVGKVVKLLGESFDTLAQIAVGVPARVGQQLPGSPELIARHGRSPPQVGKTIVLCANDAKIIILA